MSKLNPLFLDSTKGFGESVGTRIELTGPTLLPGEELFARIRDNFGRDQQISLKLEDGTFVGRIWLTHQQNITYQFYIEKDGVQIASSESKQILALHMLIEQWTPERPAAEPIIEKEASALTDISIQAAHEPIIEVDNFAEETFTQLIEKWGL